MRKLQPHQVRTVLTELENELESLKPYIERVKKLEAERKILQKSCPHATAFEHGRYSDSYEGRTYAEIKCHDCGYVWEERISGMKGKSKYSKWKGIPF